MNDEIGSLEVRSGQAQGTEAEGLQGVNDTVGVPLVGPDENIEITCIARRTVEGKGVPSDHQIFNAVGVE